MSLIIRFILTFSIKMFQLFLPSKPNYFERYNQTSRLKTTTRKNVN